MPTNFGRIRQILLAENDSLDVELTLGALREHKLTNTVVVVGNGEDALDFLHCRGRFTGREAGHPIVVLLDLKMPRMDGLELLKTIRSDEHLKLIPVVVFSSSREARDLVECYRLGVNAYVVKPVDAAEFMNAVGRLGIFWAAVNEPPMLTARSEPTVDVLAS